MACWFVFGWAIFLFLIKRTMAKEIISATIDKETANEVRNLAEKEKRSFSQMIDLLLQNALSVLKGGEKKNKK